jgi:predicted Fe-S protein YdhL (DUF1289 family)
MTKSPCNKVCKIDPVSDICKGCLRYRKEIALWPTLTDEQKWWILDDIALVRSQVYKFDLAEST